MALLTAMRQGHLASHGTWIPCTPLSTSLLLQTQLLFATVPNLIATELDVSSDPHRSAYQLSYSNTERSTPVQRRLSANTPFLGEPLDQRASDES